MATSRRTLFESGKSYIPPHTNKFEFKGGINPPTSSFSFRYFGVWGFQIPQFLGIGRLSHACNNLLLSYDFQSNQITTFSWCSHKIIIFFSIHRVITNKQIIDLKQSKHQNFLTKSPRIEMMSEVVSIASHLGSVQT